MGRSSGVTGLNVSHKQMAMETGESNTFFIIIQLPT